MTESMGGGRSVATNSRINEFLPARGRRLLPFLVVVLLILAGAVGGYIFGRQLTYSDVLAARQLTDQLQNENQALNRQITSQSADLTAMLTRLTKAETALNAIMPSADTYNVEPNQSLVVADGHLTIGLVGSPSNEGIELNVNGNQQLAAAGDVIQVAPDPTMTCQVRLQSFDMFRAVVTAWCSTKAQ